uniref:Proton-coupled zinc antiporter SLC30A5 n=1 Tax=Parascaris equorum TaxID=6256 RepID=A0A914S4N7_PAREQ
MDIAMEGMLICKQRLMSFSLSTAEFVDLRRVFLHVLADTLGSVFVIISTLLIQYFEWKWVDPLCSLILSMLILLSVYPLLMASMATLMQCIPPELEHEYDHVLCQILQLDGVLSYSRSHFWQLKSDLNVASLHVQVRDDVNDQIIRQKILQMLKEGGATQAAVQIEKDGFFHLIQSMCPSYRLPYRVTKGLSVGYNQGNCHDANDTHHGHSHGEGGHGHDHGHSHSPSESDHHRQCDGHSPNEQCSHSHAINVFSGTEWICGIIVYRLMRMVTPPAEVTFSNVAVSSFILVCLDEEKISLYIPCLAVPKN